MKKVKTSYKTETVKESMVPQDFLGVLVNRLISDGWVVAKVTPAQMSDVGLISEVHYPDVKFVCAKDAYYIVEAYRCS